MPDIDRTHIPASPIPLAAVTPGMRVRVVTSTRAIDERTNLRDPRTFIDEGTVKAVFDGYIAFEPATSRLRPRIVAALSSRDVRVDIHPLGVTEPEVPEVPDIIPLDPTLPALIAAAFN